MTADESLTFCCRTGHVLDFSELLARAPVKLLLALIDLLAAWEEELARLAGIAAESSRSGYIQIAEIVDRQFTRLERRCVALRRGLAATAGRHEDSGEESLSA